MYKNLLAVVMLTMIFGCAPTKEEVRIIKGDTGVAGTDGTSCSVAPEYSDETIVGSRVSCTDGTYSVILNGADGAPGEDGKSCKVYRSFLGAFIKCPNQWPVLVADGKDGEDGTSCSVRQTSNGARITCGRSVAFIYNGEKGDTGAAGSSCSVSNLSNGVRITCGNSSQDLFDGRDSALANAIGIASYIKPCGDEFANDEILLRMTDGKILALYDGGPHEDRLVLLAPGNYITTDRNKNRTCHFTVDAALQITNQRVQ